MTRFKPDLPGYLLIHGNDQGWFPEVLDFSVVGSSTQAVIDAAFDCVNCNTAAFNFVPTDYSLPQIQAFMNESASPSAVRWTHIVPAWFVEE